MELSSLERLFASMDHSNLERIHSLILSLEEIPSLFYGIIKGNGNDNRFVYLSPSVETITGHSVEKFSASDGMKFFYSITDKQYLPHILEREAYYIKQTRDPNFDTRNSQIMEINGGLICANGLRPRIKYLGIVLEYTSSREILVTFCTLHVESNLTGPTLKDEISLIPARLKEIHVQTLPILPATPNMEPLKVVYPLYDGPKINKREVQVLQLIADGASSKIIADRLHISFHTAETHRRNLLEKFAAKNTAELIKKASKVFWFE